MGRRGRWWPPLLLALGMGVTAVEVAVLAAAGVGSGARWASWANTWLVVLPALLIGWSFVAVGLFTWRRRPDNRVGALMTAVGFGQFTSGLWMVPVSLVYTAGLVVAVWFLAALLHLLLAFPSGHLNGRVDRALVLVGYLMLLPGNAIELLWGDQGVRPPGVHDLMLLHPNVELAALASMVSTAATLALLVVIAVVLVRRWIRGTRPQRRAVAPVLTVGAIAAVMAGMSMAASGILFRVSLLGTLSAMLVIPYAFLAGLLRVRFFQMRALGALVTRLGDEHSTADLPAALAAAFDDADAQVVYWLTDPGCYLDQTGRPVPTPTADPGRAVIPVEHDGHRIGAIIVDAAVVPAASERSRATDELVAAVRLAMDNQRLQVELRARVGELERSRADVVRAGEAQRRRLERNLHDGAQQLLVMVRLRLGMIRQSLPLGGPAGPALTEVGAHVDTALTDLDTALTELRELANGLYPTVLATRGLATAVRSLAMRTALDVRVDTRIPERLPESVESAAYFVVAESLTNVTKHAAATRADVTVTEQSDRLVVQIQDNGVGGADPAGSGLRGLAARVAALDGQLRISTPTEGGTIIRAEIPLPDRTGR